jgi:DNA helicase-2/ATP-dependent DNA helicase PcrA
MDKIKLSEKQTQIVNHLEGALLVKAGPGSGKTRVVIERIKNLLQKKKRNRVLALTFSNMAADEMKNRLEEDSSIDDLLDNVTVETIHSFCLDLVQKRGNLIGLENNLVLFEDNTERKTILRDVFLKDISLLRWLQKMRNPDQFLNEQLNLISEKKKNFIFPDMCNDQKFANMYATYNQNLLNQNAMDFDDILFFAYRILNEHPKVSKLYTSLYKYICIDEAQDLNFAQYEVIKTLCGKDFKNIMLVGDEKQSIYGFNGSDSKLMTESFCNDFMPVVYELKENYRSAKAIIRFANKFGDSDNIPGNYVYEGELKAFSFANEEEEANYIVARIKELIKTGHKDIECNLSWENFAIIGRNRYVFNKVENVLSDEGIRYFYKHSSSGIENESDYMNLFDWAIRLYVNPKDLVHLNKIRSKLHLNQHGLEFNNNTPEDFLKKLFKNKKYIGIIGSMEYLRDDSFNFKKALDIIKDSLDNIDDEDEKYLIHNDIEQWRKHWVKYTRLVRRENRNLNSFRSYVSLGKTQDISADTGISLLTAHMSKGLQYEVVFVIGLMEGTFPDYRAIKSGETAMEQEKNNMYVAVTRAKRLCYLTYPRNKMMPWGDRKDQSASRFLKGVKIEIHD